MEGRCDVERVTYVQCRISWGTSAIATPGGEWGISDGNGYDDHEDEIQMKINRKIKNM